MEIAMVDYPKSWPAYLCRTVSAWLDLKPLAAPKYDGHGIPVVKVCDELWNYLIEERGWTPRELDPITSQGLAIVLRARGFKITRASYGNKIHASLRHRKR